MARRRPDNGDELASGPEIAALLRQRAQLNEELLHVLDHAPNVQAQWPSLAVELSMCSVLAQLTATMLRRTADRFDPPARPRRRRS